MLAGCCGEESCCCLAVLRGCWERGNGETQRWQENDQCTQGVGFVCGCNSELMQPGKHVAAMQCSREAAAAQAVAA